MKNTLATTCALGLIVTAFAAQAQVTAGSSPRITNAVKPDSTLLELSANNARIKSVLENAKTKAASEGSVKVVVKLDVPYAAPNRLSIEDFRRQLGEIGAAANAVRVAMGMQTDSGSKAAGFELVSTTPYVKLTLSAEGIDKLKTVTGLVDIFPAETFSPMRDYVQTLQSDMAKRLGVAPATDTGGTITPQIFGGTPAASGTHPFQVALLSDGQAFCGGTLISEKVVVTAAHCTEPALSTLSVLVGTQKLDHGSGEIIPVTGIRRHPKWDRLNWYFGTKTPMYDYDVAILELAKAPTRKVSFATLAKALPKQNENLMVTGWGLKEDGNFSNTLMEVNVPFINTNNKICSEKWGKEPGLWDSPFTITSRMICAGGQAGKDSCGGDSGGPLTTKKAGRYSELVGIVSFGQPMCGTARWPGVYTNVANKEIQDFIKNPPPAIWIKQEYIDVTENSKTAKLTLMRSHSKGSASVRVLTMDGNQPGVSATGKPTIENPAIKGPFDFNHIDKQVTFKDGQSEVVIEIPLVNDKTKEPAESFFLLIREPSRGWALGNDTEALVDILDND